jgi:hypothetical protein
MLDCGPYAVAGGGGGGGVKVTVTENPQLAVWLSFDLAVTATAVVPTANKLPDAGVPVTVTGAAPPEDVTL